MSRRREAADLARALLLSTQLQGGEGDAGSLTSDHRRSMSLSPIPGEEATPVRSDGGRSVEMSKIWALAPTVRELPAVTDQEGEARSGGVMSVHNLLSHSESDVPLSKDTIESASDPNSRPVVSPIRSFTDSRSDPSVAVGSGDRPIPPLPSDPFDSDLGQQSGTGSSASRSRPPPQLTMEIRTFSSPALPTGITRGSSADISPESSDASRPLFSPTQTSVIRNLIGPAAGPSTDAQVGGVSPSKGDTALKTYARAHRAPSPAQTPPRLIYSGRSRITLSSSPISEPLDEVVDRGDALNLDEEEEEEAIEIVPTRPVEQSTRTQSPSRKSSSPTKPKSRIEIVLPTAASVASVARTEQIRPRKRPTSPDPLDSLSSSKRDAPASESDAPWRPPSSVPSDASRRMSKRVNDKKEKEERAKEERRRKRREEKERKMAAEAAAAADPAMIPALSAAEKDDVVAPAPSPVVEPTSVETVIPAPSEPEAGPSRAKGKRKEKKSPKGRKGKQADENALGDKPAKEEAATDTSAPTGSATAKDVAQAAAPATADRADRPAEAQAMIAPEDEEEGEQEAPIANAPTATNRDDQRSPLKAIPVRVNSPAMRASPGPRDSSGKPVRPDGIQWKTARTDLSSVLSKFPGSKPTGMSRRVKIVPLHTKIGPPPKRLPPPPPKPVKRKKGDSDDEDESEYESDGEGGTRKKVKSNERGMEWFMVED